MKIAIGSDHGGFVLKQVLVDFLKKENYNVQDFGTFSEESCDYPIFAYKVATAVARKECERGILICKSGIGNAIVANKVNGVRAALCYSIRAAFLSRRHNDANVLVLGSLFVKPDRARKIVTKWLATEFEGGRHLRRLQQIEEFEKNK